MRMSVGHSLYMESRFKTAGLELIKGNFGLAIKSLSSGGIVGELRPSEYRDQMVFFGSSGMEVAFRYSGTGSLKDAYCKCPPVSAIINRKAQAYVNGRTWVMNTAGKGKDKEAQGPVASKIRKLLARPNPLQSWKQFEAQGYVYQQLYGYNIVLSIKPVGFNENYDATALWNIPPYMLDIKESNKLFYQTDMSGIITKITLRYKDISTEIPVKDITVMQDFVPSFTSMIFPESRIASLSYPISNIIGAYESRGQLINYRGARGLLSNGGKDSMGHIPLPDDERKRIEGQFKNNYGMRAGQVQFILTNANLQWQQIGQSVKELMLFEEIDGSTMALCDAFGYPYRLLAQEKSASYNDVSEFKKMLYQDTVIPEAESNYEQWNNFFKTADHNIKLEKDYTHVQILQQDRVNEGRARWYFNQAMQIEWVNNIITANQWLVQNGMDTVADGDMYYSDWIKLGKSFSAPTPTTLDPNSEHDNRATAQGN